MAYAIIGLALALVGSWIWIYIQGRRAGANAEELDRKRKVVAHQARLLDAFGKIIDAAEGNIRKIGERVGNAHSPTELTDLYNEILPGPRSRDPT